MPLASDRTSYRRDGGIGYHITLTRPSGTLSHRMGEGWGEGKGAARPADDSAMAVKVQRKLPR